MTPLASGIVGSQPGQTVHPIDRALEEAHRRPLVALDFALRALAVIRGHRSDPETDHYLDVLAYAVCCASGVVLQSHENAFNTMIAERSCHELAAVALVRLLAVDDYALEGAGMRGTVGLIDRVAGARLYQAP